MATWSDQMQEAGRSLRLWSCRRAARQALELLGLTRSRSKFSFLIRKWGNQLQTLFLYNSFLSQNCFPPWATWFQILPQVTSWSYCCCSELLMAPCWGQGSCLTRLPLAEGSWQPQRSSRMLSPFLLDVNAADRAQRRCWFLLQKPSVVRFGGSHKKPIHPYSRCFHKLSSHLWGYLHVLPALIPNLQFLGRG